MSNLILVRGTPGQGKSFFAKKLVEQAQKENRNFLHFEADMYFYHHGEYRFDISKIGNAHLWCRNQTKEALKLGIDVIVSNTFTTHKELKDYIELAKEFNIPLVVYRMTKEYGSIHNVPTETIKKMKERFVDYEGEILVS